MCQNSTTGHSDETCTALDELDEVLYKLQPGKTPELDGFPAHLYGRLAPNLKRHVAARL